jgi:opacity protein-like surface antigen
MRIVGAFAALCALALSSGAGAQDSKSLGAPYATPTGFYVGAGGSFNWTEFDQSLQGVSGVTNVLIGPELVAQGQAGGPFFKFDRDETDFAPDFQLGYIAPFGDGWQAGLKFTYKLADIDSNESVSIPQEGSVTTTVGPPITIPFLGFVPIRSAEVELKHQFALMPTIGRSFGKVTLYAGGGPALFGTESKFLDAMCFAVIGGRTVNVCGDPLSFTSEDWVWGGAAQAGVTYALGPRWFVDLAYTYARSEEFKLRDAVSFTNTNGPLTSEGTAFLNARQRITNQSVVLTLNRAF